VSFSKYLTCSAVVLALGASGSGAGEQKEEWVRGVQLAIFARAALPEAVSLGERFVERRGVRVPLIRDGQWIGLLVIGVFADREAAEAIVEEHLLFTSRAPAKDLSPGIGDRSVGFSKSRIVWRRDNVVVELSLPEELLEAAAVKMDKALASGGPGVRRGRQVPVPQIVDVEAPARAVAGTWVPIKVTVVLADGGRDEHFGFADHYGISVILHALEDAAPKEVRMVYTMRHRAHTVEQEREESFWVCYATDGCALASRKVSFTVVPR
jgi:hypothetical protein